MKKILLLSLIVFLYSCSEDKTEDRYRSIILTETIRMDTDPVYKTETYSFVNDQLTSLNVKQRYVESETTFGTQLEYEGNTVTRTDMNGKKAVYTLNGNGYAVKCHYEESDIQRDYTFSYSVDDYLERINESVNGIPHATLTINYKDGDIIRVTHNGSPVIYESGTKENKFALPCLPLLETLLMEDHKEAYFGGLLGKPNRHLVTRTAYEGNQDEWTDYTYQFTVEGKPSAINTKLTYTGIIYDDEGIGHTTTSTIYRQIAIQME